jgi:hypothetical protein
MNYTEVEHIALVKAWDRVALNTVTINDQIENKYWQHTEDKLHRIMLKASPHSLRSIQERCAIINQSCSRWSGCLEHMRNAPSGGSTIYWLYEFVVYVILSHNYFNSSTMNVIITIVFLQFCEIYK